MLAEISHERSQSLLRQRNMLGLCCTGLAVALAISMGLAISRDREVMLVPTFTRPLTISNGGVGADYLELVTRDAALLLLNRSPEGLDYWMDSALELASPEARGQLKSDLVRIVDEQRGTDISQAFVIKAMKVDAKDLTSEVKGTLKTFVGAQVVSSEERTFRFAWSYQGLHLALAGFSQVLPPNDASAKSGAIPKEN